MERWAGKIAVVTGASSGIGRDIAKSLAENGLIVVALARRIERLEELAGATKGKIHPKKCDVSVEKEILETFDWIEKTLGGVDVLINNAGIGRVTSLNNGITEDWKSVFDVNILGLCICTREALKTMRKRGDNGHIMHINSILGHYHGQYESFPVGIYEASKHAVTSLTESLRVELRGLKSRIKITSISPGGVKTEIFRSARKNSKTDPSDLAKMIFTRREECELLDPEDITGAAMYALSTKPNVQVHEIIIQPIGQTLG